MNGLPTATLWAVYAESVERERATRRLPTSAADHWAETMRHRVNEGAADVIAELCRRGELP